MKIDNLGIQFRYYGDYLWYLWPWKRNKWREKYLSLLCEGRFSSLKEIREFWNSFEQALNTKE